METSPAQTPSTALSQSVPRHALDKELAVARLFLRTKPSDVSCRGSLLICLFAVLAHTFLM